MLILLIPLISFIVWLYYVADIVSQDPNTVHRARRSRSYPSSTSRKTYLDHNGYWRFKDSDILVHRYVAQKQVGRRLKNGEVVHHIDGNKWNNNSNNLHVCTQEEHHNIHLENLRVSGNWYGY